MMQDSHPVAGRPVAEGFAATLDVLVIGAGGCGLTAALAAAAAGAEVAVVEKAPRCGGNTALSSGSIPAAGTALQAAAGIADSPEAFAADLDRVAGPHDAPHLVTALTRASAPLIAFLLAEGVRLTLVTGYRHVGHGVHRLHAPPARRGADLLADLERAVARRAIPVAFGQPARGLIFADGRVRGAVVEDGTSEGLRIGAGAVILATNGFGAAPGLLQRHCPGTAGAAYGGAPTSTGEALDWGAEIGAATGNLGAWQGHAGLCAETGALMTWTLVERGAIVVDAAGRRFGDETLGYSAFAELALQAAAPLYLIHDARIRADVAAGQPDFAEACAMGAARPAADPAALADATGLPAAALADTLRTAAEAAAGRRPDPFGRSAWGLGPLGRPLCATRIRPALFHTQGGLMVDAAARVLRPDGRPIPGLHAGGGAAAGLSGRQGAAGYVSGNGLLAALGLGYLAGRAAAAAAAPATADLQHGG